MNDRFKKIILKATGSADLKRVSKIQDLWSGYGEIVRFALKGSSIENVIVKHVSLPDKNLHPRGWNSNLSHERKLKSYQVEMSWYKTWAKFCDDRSRVAECFACESQGDEFLIVLEDLDASGFAVRKTSVSIKQIKLCLKWLAYFHATYLNEKPEGLWGVGTYWHLDTRPDELKVLDDPLLKKSAKQIDQTLKSCKFQTFVHGDAKLANFCFANSLQEVAAVDFQYVGGGCGMKDVIYFIGSCLHDDDCEVYEKELLDYYFKVLVQAVTEKKKDVDLHKLEDEWRLMYKVAWTDFHRFIKGWSPGHWKINSYSERLAQQTLEEL